MDECHRALSAEGMKEIKNFSLILHGFGFTGTPIFDVNKKQAKGRLARTTRVHMAKSYILIPLKRVERWGSFRISS